MNSLLKDFPGEVVVQQMLDLFVKPEIDRRVDAGLLDKPVNLRAFQILLRDDGPPEVRLNSEVKVIAQVRVNADRELETGDPIYESDVQDIESVELMPDDDPDCAHVTFFIASGMARIAFDFRYNRSLATRHLDTAAQFLEAAEESLEANRLAVFFDCLLSAAELSARAVLLTAPDKRFKKRSSHRDIQKRYGGFVSLGNADSGHANALLELRKLRDALRYVTADRQVEAEDAQRYLSTMQTMYEDARQRVA